MAGVELSHGLSGKRADNRNSPGEGMGSLGVDDSSTSAFKWLSRLSRYSSALAVAFGAMVLAGWALHIQRLKGILTGQVAVKANTAACFVLIGAALWLAQEGKQNVRRQLLSRVLAATASLVGLLSFLECWYGWDLGIDQLLFTAGAEDLPGSLRPGLMSPIAAADFFLLGLTLNLLDIENRWCRWAQNFCIVLAIVASIFGILDFVLDPENTHTHIAPLTALTLFLFCFGVICARTRWGLGKLLVSPRVGGLLCRRLLPASILLPIGIGWLRWKGEQTGLFSDWTGLAIMTVTSGMLLAVLTVWTALAMERGEAERNKAEESVRALATIVSSSHDAIISKTLDGIVTS